MARCAFYDMECCIHGCSGDADHLGHAKCLMSDEKHPCCHCLDGIMVPVATGYLVCNTCCHQIDYYIFLSQIYYSPEYKAHIQKMINRLEN